MFSLFTNESQTGEAIPRSSFPWVWFGFLFPIAFLVLETIMVILEMLEAPVANAGLFLIALSGGIYWLVCVYGLHKILEQLTRSRYPISPGQAALMHLIPFYNFYWLFKWPAELSRYINSIGRVRMVSGYLVGFLLLLATLVRFFDGALGLAFLFGVTFYLSAKLKRHVRSLKEMSPENLPPIPDPKMFDRPLQQSQTVQAIADQH